MLTRRQVLVAGAAGVAGSFLPIRWMGSRAAATTVPLRSPTLTKYVTPLVVPPGIAPDPATGRYTLTMGVTGHSFHRDLPAGPVWTYNGSLPGPTFEVWRGQPVDVDVVNALGTTHLFPDAIDLSRHGATTEPRTSVHLHGGNTAPDSDGFPMDTFGTGVTRSYHYANNQESATLWYHDHAMGVTRLNVYAGLAGGYLVRDAQERALALPSGAYEVPLVFGDRLLNADGSVAYPNAPWQPEFFGDVAIVNGKAWPNLVVDRGWYRFRMVNGCAARFLRLRLSNDQPMYQIGSDGGLLDAPIERQDVLFAPGERLDVLIDFSRNRPGQRLIMTNEAATPYPNGPTENHPDGISITEYLQFSVSDRPGYAMRLPGALRSAPIPSLPAPPAGSGRVRNLLLIEHADPVTGEVMMGMLNNLPWSTSDIETPRVDTVEQWNIINTTGDTHPIHLHLVQFQVLQRQAFDADAYLAAVFGPDPSMVAGQGPWPVRPAEPYLLGRPVRPREFERRCWKDTVQCPPGQVTRLLVPFGAKAAPGVPFGESFTGDYVWHCHMLEHEDNEMMLPFRVVP